MTMISQLFGPIVAGYSSGSVAFRTQEVRLEQVVTDSRLAGPDSVFFAIRGTQHDGHSHVEDLLRRGVLVCVVEDEFKGTDPRLIRVRDSREALGWAMAALHGHPSRSLKMVGVTGTSGKTTTTYIIERILSAAGHKVGVIGTVNFRIGDEVLPSTHTTPGSPELQALLARMKDSGCTAVVMEVSSHALKQHRTAGIAFDGVVFNNLSPEHLDFHPDMEDYFRSKKVLFSVYPDHAGLAGKSCVAAINADDPYGARLISELAGTAAVPFGMETAGLSGGDLKLGLEGIRGSLSWSDGCRLGIRSALIGRFNAYNLMAAAAACRALGVRPEFIASGIEVLKGVPGRLEQVPNSLGIVILVDYAHKPDALEKVLRTLGEVRVPGQRILTVVGCGGDRDRTKRPVMGRLADQLSDLAFITSDNPRTEDPRAIIEEILRGIPGFERGGSTGQSGKIRVEPDRARAIQAAVGEARSGDLVLIAGKGHEDYQIIAGPVPGGGTRKIHFDDREVAAEACRRRANPVADG